MTPTAEAAPDVAAATQRRISLANAYVGEAEAGAARELISSGCIAMGAVTAPLERELTASLGGSEAVLVSSGTAALHLSMLIAGVGPGDEVLVPSMSFVATASAVVMAGATPRFADIVSLAEPCLDPKAVASAITDKTKAVVVTHLAGFPARVDDLLAITDDAGIDLIEDCAHAPLVEYAGKQLGTFGRLGCLSFHTTKSVSMGEGGAVICNNRQDACQARSLRNHGLQRDDSRFTYDVVDLGFNYRPNEVAAAIGSVQLSRLGEDRERRAELRASYETHLKSIPDITLPFEDWQGDSAHHLLPVLLPPGADRDAVRRHLLESGIESGVHYRPIHELSHYRQAPCESLDISVDYGRRHLTLPLHPRLTPDDVSAVADALANCSGL